MAEKPWVMAAGAGVAAPWHNRPPARGQERLKPLTDKISFFCQAMGTCTARHTSPGSHKEPNPQQSPWGERLSKEEAECFG